MSMLLNIAKQSYWSLITLWKLFRQRGFDGVRALYAKKTPIKIFEIIRPQIEKKVGLEIGGPTFLFTRGRLFPVYSIAKRVDNCNFQVDTFFQGRAPAGRTFMFDWRKRHGYQLVLEATDLADIPSNGYDFILSSHNIEHLANPIKALHEWIRVLKNWSYLILIVPHKEGTFDHRRDVTKLSHIIDDFEKNTQENDTTHVEDILRRHDLSRDPSVASFDEFRETATRNMTERRLHHHVFDTQLVLNLLDYVGLQIRHVQLMKPYHIVAVAEKLGNSRTRDNGAFLSSNARIYLESPFVSDRSGAVKSPESA